MFVYTLHLNIIYTGCPVLSFLLPCPLIVVSYTLSALTVRLNPAANAQIPQTCSMFNFGYLNTKCIKLWLALFILNITML